MLFYITSIIFSSLLSLIILKKIKLILTIKDLINSYKDYFIELKKFSKNEINTKIFLISLKKIIFLTLLVIFKAVSVIIPFFIIYII